MDCDDNDLPKNFSVVTGTHRLPSEVNSSPFSMADDTKPVEIGNRVGAITPTHCHHTEAQLTFEEKKFLLAVERGDLATVRRTLEKAKETGYININCVDPLGRSALLMAIDNENLEMVEMLIENRVETKDALLHAISEEYVEAVEVLLDHEEQIHKPFERHSWEAIDPDAATFTPDITPLILAAHRDNYEIIKLLLDRGSTLPVPHDVRCGCNECVTSRREDSLRHSRSRINAYRALASPSLIALSSKDPILTAFELSWELQRLSFLEHEFKTEYLELRKQCQDFGTALLDHTRSSYELEILLNHDPTGPAFEHGERMHLNRLKLAIKYRQKKFVAHSNVQQLLASIWYEGLPGFRRKNIVLQTLQILWIGLLFPFYSIIYIFLPHSKLGQTLRKPFIKFICHSTSYVTFLFLLILASQRIESFFTDWGPSPSPSEENTANSSNGSAQPEIQKYDMLNNRGSMPTFVEWMIFAWVMGLIWAEIKPLWEDGFYAYINDMWNIIDFITNSLYVATIALRVVAYYQVKKELAEGKDSANLGREQWDDWDPMLISEGLFSAANIFSSLKLVYIFSVNPYLGPLQISLGRMVIDIIKFFFVYSLVLFAFACGTNQLLWYYADLDKRKCNEALKDKEETKSESDACYRWRRFANLFESIQTLFWAAFGLVDLNNFELTGIKSYTRFWGLLMFGSYSVINVVVLLNLLIAMMNHSYQLISERTDTEWKFARSKLWMSYFEEGGTVPPPFNIIPTPKTVYYLCRWFGRKICGRSRAAKKEFIRTIRKKARQASERDFRYQSMMRNLVRRYITQEQRKADNQGVTEDDVNEIKQDISSFRYELIEILKNSGMNTSFAQDQPQGPGGKKGRQRERRLMKGFKIVPAAEGFPTGDAALALGAAGEIAIGLGPGSSLPLSASLVHSPSPIGRLRRAARLANTKQPSSTSSRRRWGTLVDAAKSVRHTLGRSISQDSFGSQCSLSFQGVSGGPGVAGVTFSSTEASGGSLSLTSLPAGSTSIDSTIRPPGTLRSRFAFMHQAAAKLRSPSFEESKRSAKARRNLYGGKIHTGSLKNFEKRSACSPVFSSQRTPIGKIVHKAEPVSASSGTASPKAVTAPHEHRLRRLRLFRYNHNRHTPPEKEPSSPPPPPETKSSSSQQNSQPASLESHKGYQRSPMTLRPDLGVALTPIPSQPSSSARSSPEQTPQASPTRTDTTYGGDYLGVASSSVYAVSGQSGQQTSVAASKPSNGSAILSKLPGIQPIGKHVPGGWL